MKTFLVDDAALQRELDLASLAMSDGFTRGGCTVAGGETGVNISLNHVRNALSGFLSAYGITAFLCFILLVLYWARVSPSAPDPEHGYIFPHNEHGAITYFSSFQGTSCTLLFATSIPLAFLAAFIIPKRFTSRMRWEEDDPAGLFRIGSICGTIAAPVIIFILGPPLVVWLNATGFAVGF